MDVEPDPCPPCDSETPLVARLLGDDELNATDRYRIAEYLVCLSEKAAQTGPRPFSTVEQEYILYLNARQNLIGQLMALAWTMLSNGATLPPESPEWMHSYANVIAMLSPPEITWYNQSIPAEELPGQIPAESN